MFSSIWSLIDLPSWKSLVILQDIHSLFIIYFDIFVVMTKHFLLVSIFSFIVMLEDIAIHRDVNLFVSFEDIQQTRL